MPREVMRPPPPVAPVEGEWELVLPWAPAGGEVRIMAPPPRPAGPTAHHEGNGHANGDVVDVQRVVSGASTAGLVRHLVQFQAHVASLHNTHLSRLFEAQQRFLSLRQRAEQTLFEALGRPFGKPPRSVGEQAPQPGPEDASTRLSEPDRIELPPDPEDASASLWEPDPIEPPPGRIDSPPRPTTKQRFGPRDLEALRAGRLSDCFGAGFEWGDAHVLTPLMGGSGQLRSVERLDLTGGPWATGYLRAEGNPADTQTQVFDTCLEAMAFYLIATGVTLDRDGWRFTLITDASVRERSRGLMATTPGPIVCELFVQELITGDEPSLRASVRCRADDVDFRVYENLGLRLVPDVPLSAAMSPVDSSEPSDVAFDHHALLSFSLGWQDQAFGPVYRPYRGRRRAPRTPGPPYHFVSRIRRIADASGLDGAQGLIEAEYDVDAGEWYFPESHPLVMPHCVLLEALMQPCGYLVAWLGCGLGGDETRFRNLDGQVIVHQLIGPDAGVLRVRARLDAISSAGGIVLVAFHVESFIGDARVAELDTKFGYFTEASLANQVGLRRSGDEVASVQAPWEGRPIDLSGEPDRYYAGSLRLPSGRLRMLDRVTGYEPDGGRAGLGRVRAEKDVDPGAWFFKAHFYEDPVQPGTLGLEAMAQLLKWTIIERKWGTDLGTPWFEPVALEHPMVWKYRGQVLPINGRIVIELEVLAVEDDEAGRRVSGQAWLWVDRLCIYESTLCVRVVSRATARPGLEANGWARRPSPSGPGPSRAEEHGSIEVLDPTKDRWLTHHCPTFVVPTLAGMSMVDRLVVAACRARPDQIPVGLEDVQILGWLTVSGPRRLRTEVREVAENAVEATLLVWRQAGRAELSRFEPVARGVVRMGWVYPEAMAESLAPLVDPRRVDNPYESGRLFHGPVLQVLRELVMGANGSTALLDAGASSAPLGALNQALLDGLVHGIPHDDLGQWSNNEVSGQVGYPSGIRRATFYGPPPKRGEVRCEVRFAGLEDDRFARFVTRATHRHGDSERLWLSMDYVEVLFPLGPLGMLPPGERRAFMRDGQPVDGAGLSTFEADETRLDLSTVHAQDWLPGTVPAIYRAGATDAASLTRVVACKDHLARRLDVHPRDIVLDDGGRTARCRSRPLTRFPLEVVTQGNRVHVRDAGRPAIDIDSVMHVWDSALGGLPRASAEPYLAMLERFTGRVVLEDPDAFDAVKGRGLLFLANHQVVVESFSFLTLAAGLTGLPARAVARVEHRDDWVGRLIDACFSHPAVGPTPRFMVLLDRANRRELLDLVVELREDLRHMSILIHVEGTLARACRQPVRRMSSKLLDLALAARAPVVPVRFSGALPIEPATASLEFPVGYARQDVFIGAPIDPERLAAMPYAERRSGVLDAINRLGSLDDERPNPPHPAFTQRVADWQSRLGLNPVQAVLLECLRAMTDPSPSTQRLVRGFEEGRLRLGSSAEDQWLRRMVAYFAGTKGPVIEDA